VLTSFAGIQVEGRNSTPVVTRFDANFKPPYMARNANIQAYGALQNSGGLAAIAGVLAEEK
jgi:hypothetical protein